MAMIRVLLQPSLSAYGIFQLIWVGSVQLTPWDDYLGPVLDPPRIYLG